MKNIMKHKLGAARRITSMSQWLLILSSDAVAVNGIGFFGILHYYCTGKIVHATNCFLFGVLLSSYSSTSCNLCSFYKKNNKE